MKMLKEVTIRPQACQPFGLSPLSVCRWIKTWAVRITRASSRRPPQEPEYLGRKIYDESYARPSRDDVEGSPILPMGR